MTTILPPGLHEHQQAIWDAMFNGDARYISLACGRRWGKTRLGSLMCIKVAVDGGRAWWVAPSYKVATVGWRLIKRLAVQIPGAEIRQVDKLITLPNGGEVQVRSADDPDSLRGEGLDFVVMDECAFIKEAAWSEALRPALSDRQGKALFISTPSGRNWFYRHYQRGLGSADGWASYRFPTSANPFIVPDEIEAAKLDLPSAIFEQEYLAEFLENQGAVFRNIRPCLHSNGGKPDDHFGHYIVAGVDWGKQADFTAISVICQTCGKEIALDRFNKIDYHFQRGRLEVLCETWGVGYILAESNAMGEPVIEELQRAGLPVDGFQTTAVSKPPLIENLALTLEREELKWIDDPVATGELEAYERHVSPTTGRSSYSAPEGLHDDTVMARALAAWTITGGNAGPAVIEL